MGKRPRDTFREFINIEERMSSSDEIPTEVARRMSEKLPELKFDYDVRQRFWNLDGGGLNHHRIVKEIRKEPKELAALARICVQANLTQRDVRIVIEVLITQKYHERRIKAHPTTVRGIYEMACAKFHVRPDPDFDVVRYSIL